MIIYEKIAKNFSYEFQKYQRNVVRIFLCFKVILRNIENYRQSLHKVKEKNT